MIRIKIIVIVKEEEVYLLGRSSRKNQFLFILEAPVPKTIFNQA
jgi:hypothetical protein